jgi:hypothetical protein
MDKSKLIIHCGDDIPHSEALRLVNAVIREGLVSGPDDNRQYCYVTHFESLSSGLITVVTATKRGNTHTFKVFIKPGEY